MRIIPVLTAIIFIIAFIFQIQACRIRQETSEIWREVEDICEEIGKVKL